jgi:hypothetical protein
MDTILAWVNLLNPETRLTHSIGGNQYQNELCARAFRQHLGYRQRNPVPQQRRIRLHHRPTNRVDGGFSLKAG